MLSYGLMSIMAFVLSASGAEPQTSAPIFIGAVLPVIASQSSLTQLRLKCLTALESKRYKRNCFISSCVAEVRDSSEDSLATVVSPP